MYAKMVQFGEALKGPWSAEVGGGYVERGQVREDGKGWVGREELIPHKVLEAPQRELLEMWCHF